MKKNTSLLLSGLLVSGMVLGGVVTEQTVNAADATTEASAKVTNNVSYTNKATNQIMFNRNLEGVQGQQISYLPDGYTFAGNAPLYGSDQANINVVVTPMTTATVNYIDANKKVISTETVNGGQGNFYKLTNLPKGYTFTNPSDQNINLGASTTYNVSVKPSTTVEGPVVTVGATPVKLYTSFGNLITGRALNANSSWKTFEKKVINGQTYYRVATNEWVNAADVTVKDAPAEGVVTPYKAVATTKNANTVLYTKDGKQIGNRVLSPNSAWKTFNKLVLNGKTYYQVATDEWLSADDSTVTAAETETPVTKPTTDTSVQKSDKSVVTTKTDSQQYTLYTDQGVAVGNRVLGPNSAWIADKMQTINGETMYRVATNEWLKASELQ